MPVLRFVKPLPEIPVEKGANLMQTLLGGGRPVASSCNGEGVCIKCKIKIVSGMENLSRESSREKDLREIHDIPKGERLACQCTVEGDVTLDTTYW